MPTRLKLLNWGRNESTEGPVLLDDESIRVFEANQKLIGRGRCQLDFEHNTVPGTAEYERTKEPRAVAAFARPVIVKGDGLYFEDINWNAIGRDNAASFEDLSLAPFLDKERRVIAVHSAALTKAGAVYDLPRFADQAELASMSATLSGKQTSTNMNPETIITVAELAPAFGLKSDAAKGEVLARFAVLAAIAGIVGIKDGKVITLGAIDLKDGKLMLPDAGTKAVAVLSATVDGKVVTFTGEDVVKLASRVEELDTRLKTSSEAVAKKQTADLVTLFATDGKVPKKADGQAYTADELSKLPVETLQLLHANTAVTVPLSARNRTGQFDGEKKKHRDDKGIVDLSAVFNEENAAAARD